MKSLVADLRRAAQLPQLGVASVRAWVRARRRGIPGMDFDAFGRRLGLTLALRGHRAGVSLMLNPVSTVRYFEFDFVRSELPAAPALRCLDVSSPHLFGLWLLARRPGCSVRMINPDPADIAATQAMARHAPIRGLDARCEDLREAVGQGHRYDLVTSISVIEHIAGPYDDREAIVMMWEALAPGGRLLLTFPVDRTARDELRSSTVYSSRSASAATKSEAAGEPVFFQRFYTAATIAERLLAPLGSPPHHTAWFGEVAPGRYAAHAARWRAEGLAATVADPALIADSFRRFVSWDEMPGMGVCGLRIDKPAEQGGP